MKKLLLSAIVLSFAFSALAQQRTALPQHLKNISVTKEFQKPVKDLSDQGSVVFKSSGSLALAPMEDEIGQTLYDLQTNSALGNRLWRHDDGTMSAVWTFSLVSNYSERGTGYNYFDGTTWGPAPTVRIDNARTGWPSIAPLGPDGEINVAHLVSGLLISKRATKGTGAWDYITYMGPAAAPELSWPRVITTGADHNTIHLISNSYTAYLGQTSALLYSRSTTGAQTWEIDNLLLPGLGIDSYTFINADDYVFAPEKNGTIAFIVGGEWHDLFLMKSTDNGTNWTKTVIWQHPYPMWNWDTSITTDTLWAVDGGINVALDNEGMAHVVFGLCRVAHTEPGTTYNFWPYSDGIGYWNESMGPLPAHPTNPHKTLNPDFLESHGNLIGWVQDVDGNGEIDIFDLEIMSYRTLGLSTMPTLHIDDMNRIFLIFSSVTEGFDDGAFYYKKLWARSSPDNGTTWGDFVHLTEDLVHMFDECIFPQFAQSSDEYVYYFYNADESPGLALDGDHATQTNQQIFAKIAKPELVGTGDILNKVVFNVSQNYPNPATSATRIMVDLPSRSPLSLEVYNLMGQKVLNLDKGMVNAGTHIFDLNVSGFNNGIYFYTVKAGANSTTRKMVVR